LTADFIGAHRTQWNAFVKKMGERDRTDAFGRIVEDLKKFARPMLRVISRGERLSQNWKAGKGWVTS